MQKRNWKELERVLLIGGFPLIGINNRDLATFKTDLEITERLAEKLFLKANKQDVLLVSESGLFTSDDLRRVYKAGARAVLVGESLMREENVCSALRKLIGY